MKDEVQLHSTRLKAAAGGHNSLTLRQIYARPTMLAWVAIGQNLNRTIGRVCPSRVVLTISEPRPRESPFRQPTLEFLSSNQSKRKDKRRPVCPPVWKFTTLESEFLLEMRLSSQSLLFALCFLAFHGTAAFQRYVFLPFFLWMC
jgi:hypothetical protein